MDFQSLKRRDLQSLCKLNHIPANITNAAMIDALSSLDFIEGLEEFLGKPESEPQGSPERSVITSPALPPTTTRRRALKDEVESSKLAPRTRGGTKTKAKEGTDTRKTPATRTTRKRACQEASVKKDMEKDLQADFEASEVSEDSVQLGVELKEISEEVSGVSLDNEGQLPENQIETQSELQQSNDEQDVNDADAVNVIDDQEESSEGKVDFHSLTRKDLQNLCKKNKIPANITNAAMADALASLETVEGLQEFLNDYHSEALKSPQASGIATSCARRSRTTVKITKEEPRSSKLVTKSCRGSRRRILEEEQVQNDMSETPVGSALCEGEINQKKEESAVLSCELKQLDISSMDDIECPAVLSNGEDAEISEVSGVGELSSKINNSKDDVLNVENLNEPEGLVVKVDEITVEESSKDAEVFIVVGENSREGELEKARVQDSRTFEVDAVSESDGPNHGDLVSAPSLIVEDQISEECNSESSTQAKQLLSSELKEHNNSEGSNSGDEFFTHSMSVKSDIETTEADKLSLNSSGESESDDSCVEDDTSDDSDSDSELESEGSVTEEDTSVKSDIETTTQGKLAEINVESEIEDSFTEEESDSESILQENQDTNVDIDSEEQQISMKSDIEITTQGDKLSEINAASELEGSYSEDEKFNPELISQENQANNVDIGTTEADLCASSEMNQLEKVEITADSAIYGHVVSNKIDTENPQADLCAPTDQETPLKFKSLRKLKRILKGKLQAAALTTSMENLTLEESKKPITEVKEDLHGVPVKLSEDTQESEGSIDTLQGNLQDEALSNDLASDTSENEAIKSDVNATTLFPVEVLEDNEVIPEDAITGDIDVIACPAQSTPTKFSSNIKKQPLLFTPPSKRPMSAGKKNCVLEVNKENIDDSAASKTEPGKVTVAITESGKLLSAMSMGKLKKEFKVLQQSEKKRQALQSRSENNCFLTSP